MIFKKYWGPLEVGINSDSGIYSRIFSPILITGGVFICLNRVKSLLCCLVSMCEHAQEKEMEKAVRRDNEQNDCQT